jgi:hypothetical protein
MLKLDDDARIRQAHREGMSIRGLAKLYHHSRQKIREVLECPEPRPYRRSEPYTATKPRPFQTWIDEILKTDDGGTAGSADPQVPSLRNEWRKCSVLRVDEIEAEQQAGVKRIANRQQPLQPPE